MEIEKGLDTGAVFARAATPIDDEETAGELRERLVALGTDLLIDTLPDIASITPDTTGGGADVRRQADGRGVRARLLAPARRAASASSAAGNPRPGAWTTVDGRRLKVWRARVGRRRLVRAPRSAARGQGAHVERRVDARPSGCTRPVRLVTSSRLRRARRARPHRRRRVRAGAPAVDAARFEPARSRSRVHHRPRLRHGACATPARRPGDACGEASAPPTGSSRARRAPTRRVPAAPRRATARRGVGDRRRAGGAFAAGARLRQRRPARAHAARSAVARAVERRGRALVPRLARRAACP